MKTKFLFITFLTLSVLKTNCAEQNPVIKFVTTKPLYTAMLVYTACWAKNRLNTYAQTNTLGLAFWIASLISAGVSQNDADLWPVVLFMPKHGLLG